MKKKFLIMGLVLSLGGLALVGCGNNSGNYEDYITLGDYKALKVDKPERKVSEAEIKEIRDDELSYYIDYEEYDGPASRGDLVELSMTAKIGSELIYDFTGEDETYEIVLGDEEFGKEFDYNITGQMKGAKFEFTIQYDDSEEDSNLAGRSVDFKGELFAISKTIYPEVNDEFIRENTEYNSVSEWENYIVALAQENVDYENNMAFNENLGKALIDSCTIKGCPDDLYNRILTSYLDEYESYAEMFNTTVDDIYASFEVTREDIEQMAKEACYQQMALELIAQKEGISISDSEFDTLLANFADSEGYESTEEVLGDYNKDDLKNIFLQDKTLDFLADKAIITVITD